AKYRVVDRLCQPAARKPTDVQVFNCNQIVLLNQLTRCLKVEVPSRPLHLSVPPCEDTDHLLATLAPTLALGDAALRTLQRGFGPSEMPGILDKLPIRRGKKFLQSQVDADRLTGFGKWAFRNVITGKGDPPVAAPVPAKRDGLDAPLDRPRKKQLRRADPLKGEPPAFELPAMLPEGHAVVARATLETRITGLLTLLHTTEERL